VLGLPVAGRNHRHLEGLIGFFVNSLVLRVDMSGDPSFDAVMARVREVTLEAFEHQDLPFEKLVEELQVERDLSRNPLFQVTFQLINAPTLVRRDAPTDGDITTSTAVPKMERGTAMFDLAFDLIEAGDQLIGRIEYSTDLFDTATVEQFAAHFAELLRNVIAHPEARISTLGCVSERERSQTLDSGLGPVVAYDTTETLHGAVALQAQATPTAVAVVAGDHTLTYRELDQRVNQLANALVACGVQPGDLVGVSVPASAHLVVAVLAVLKAGGAYVPLDPSHPPARLRKMAERIVLALVGPAERDLATSLGAPCLVLDPEWECVAGQARRAPNVAVRGEDLAYVISTSGSTGEPKGVMISHRAAVNHMRWMASSFAFRADDRVLQRTPLGFDASVWEFFVPLQTGATLVVAPPGRATDPAELVELVRRQDITMMQLVPSLLALVLEEPEVADCTSLRAVFSGGEVLSPSVRDRCHAQLGATLHNLYGPTEATIDALSWTCERTDVRPTIPIGRPIANCRAYVLDARFEPVPRGAPGELFLGGAGIAHGYRDRPRETAAQFLPDPFAAGPGARMYATGDIVRQLADGTFVYLGRADDQVKVHGLRVELGDVEAALRPHPGVREVAASVSDAAGGDRRLVAYVVPGTPAPTSDELRRVARESLPDALIPSFFVVVDQLPRTPSGKIDRRALPAPDRAAARDGVAYEAARTPLEQVLVSLWSEVLGAERVGVHDGFFNELGGHSLLATQLVSRVRELFGVPVPLPRVFERPTVAEFAAALIEDAGDEERIVETAELILLVEGLTDEEVEELLARAERAP
jgi:amino acid adenylation domain-containing protein